MGALDRMRQASQTGQKYSAAGAGALERMRAAGTAQANRKQETTRVKSEIPTPAINTRNSGSNGLSSSAKVSQRVASDWKTFQDKQKQRAQTQAKADSLTRQLSERSASGDMGGTTLMRTELDRLNNQLKYGNAVYKNDWTGQTKAKYAQTALSLDAGKAANDYLNRPTQENWQAAVQARDALEDFQTRNRTALSAGSGKSAGDTTLGDSIKSFVGNLPQLGSQLKSAAQYGAVGAGAGSVIPLVGTVSGLKVGVAAGSAAESYALMRGTAFMELMELGVDEETARKAAGDEAFLSALVEMGDTLMDVSGVGLGAGSLINAAKTGVVRALAKEGAEAAAENAAAKVLKLAGKYGLNILQEAGEEGIQQSVSIANRNRLVKTGVQTGSPLLGYTVISPSAALKDGNAAASVGELLGESVKTLGRALTGKDAQARDEIARAALEGGKIAAVSGSVMPVVQTAVGAGAGTIAKAVQNAAEPARTRSPGRVSVSQEEPAAAYITPKYETASVESPTRYESANDTTPEPDAVETSGDPFTQPDGQRQFLTGLNEGEKAAGLTAMRPDGWKKTRQSDTKTGTYKTPVGEYGSTATEPTRTGSTHRAGTPEETATEYTVHELETSDGESPTQYEGVTKSLPEPDVVEIPEPPLTETDLRHFLAGLNEGEEAGRLTGQYPTPRELRTGEIEKSFADSEVDVAADTKHHADDNALYTQEPELEYRSLFKNDGLQIEDEQIYLANLAQLAAQAEIESNQRGKDFTSPENRTIMKIISGARITNMYSQEARAHAERYYGLVRSMKTDVARIAKNTGYSEKVIQEIKNFIFLEKHDLGDPEPRCFDSSFEMAQSWQRLIEGKQEPHDLTMLKHEVFEKELMDKGFSQEDAHLVASRRYNYVKESNEYYAAFKEYKNR